MLLKRQNHHPAQNGYRYAIFLIKWYTVQGGLGDLVSCFGSRYDQFFIQTTISLSYINTYMHSYRYIQHIHHRVNKFPSMSNCWFYGMRSTSYTILDDCSTNRKAQSDCHFDHGMSGRTDQKHIQKSYFNLQDMIV